MSFIVEKWYTAGRVSDPPSQVRASGREKNRGSSAEALAKADVSASVDSAASEALADANDCPSEAPASGRGASLPKILESMITARFALASFVFAFAVGVSLLIALVVGTDPRSVAWYLKIGFFSSFFIATFGFAGILVYGFQRTLGSRMTWLDAQTVIRQALFLALLSTVALLAQSARLMTIWTAILLFLLFGLIELFFLTNKNV